LIGYKCKASNRFSLVVLIGREVVQILLNHVPSR
jgi:hypothetical protein